MIFINTSTLSTKRIRDVRMAKAMFEIGETEKHRFTVKWSLFMKHLTIELDDEKVTDEFHYSPAPKKYHFEVGNTEKHQVEISAGGFSAIKVFVDGKALELS
jgi:hypothetical protein